MVIRSLCLFILITGCGREVKLSNAKLEKFSSITEAENTHSEQSGLFQRASKNGEFDYIKIGSKSYKISMYSSNDTFKFITATPPGSEVQIKFKGTIKNVEIVVETIEAQ